MYLTLPNRVNQLPKTLPTVPGQSLIDNWQAVYNDIMDQSGDYHPGVAWQELIKRVLGICQIVTQQPISSHLQSQYYFYAASIRYMLNYPKRQATEGNIQKFTKKINPHLAEIYKTIQSFSANAEVQRSKKQWDDKHYTVYYDPNNADYQYFLVSPMLLAVPTLRSYVKLVFPITVIGGQMRIIFSSYYVLKVEFYQDQSYPGTKEHNILYGATSFYPPAAATIIKRRVIFKMFPGLTLFEFINRYFLHSAAVFSTEHIVNIFLAMALALQTVHQQGYIHADIKTDNIILNVTSDINGSIEIMAYIIDADNMHAIGERKKQKFIGNSDSAPELLGKLGPYFTMQTSIDIYALGKCFEQLVNCLNRSSLIYGSLKTLTTKMIYPEAADRYALDVVISKLKEILQSITSLPNYRTPKFPVNYKHFNLPTLKDMTYFPSPPSSSVTPSTPLLSHSQHEPDGCCVIL